ncbi:hypothetical protein Lalb_Chr05g0217451 [Lupinus albus]|uniref:Uncharacterized protein n=1 Tax=Lupinus albus TaxID=3870 RepID=A0A6A4QJ14_LUPAL|nr:hypothetical protein Lalb_Chr05g0217451 [Lupinus albus]
MCVLVILLACSNPSLESHCLRVSDSWAERCEFFSSFSAHMGCLNLTKTERCILILF